jgi:hypothetical protein
MEKLTSIQLITDERKKQIDKHGFTAEHHIRHPEWYDKGQLQYAATALLSMDGKSENTLTETPLNWDSKWFNNMLERSSVERLVIAGALIAAELDRLVELDNLRNNQKPPGPQPMPSSTKHQR